METNIQNILVDIFDMVSQDVDKMTILTYINGAHTAFGGEFEEE